MQNILFRPYLQLQNLFVIAVRSIVIRISSLRFASLLLMIYILSS